MAASLQNLSDAALASAFQKFPAVKSNQVAITLIDLAETNNASYRGEVPIYPASVVKLFYLVAAHRWMEDGRIKDTAELRRATQARP